MIKDSNVLEIQENFESQLKAACFTLCNIRKLGELDIVPRAELMHLGAKGKN